MQHLGREAVLDVSSAFNTAQKAEGDLDAVVFGTDVIVEQELHVVGLQFTLADFQTLAFFSVMLLQDVSHGQVHASISGSPVGFVGEGHARFVPHEIVLTSGGHDDLVKDALVLQAKDASGRLGARTGGFRLEECGREQGNVLHDARLIPDLDSVANPVGLMDNEVNPTGDALEW